MISNYARDLISLFVTAEDLLKKTKENVETDDDNRIWDD
jgi:hypothetical protein